MKQHIQAAKTYITTHKKAFVVGMAVTLAIVVLITAIILFIQNSKTKIVYQPANACDLLTPKEAQELLGSKAPHSGVQTPVLSGDTAISRCGYTDGNPDTNTMVVAAIVVRSGVNDKGVAKNKTEFETNQSAKDVEPVKNLGDSAYFNKNLGQLNVLKGHEWIIFSYGVGASPSTNTLDDAVKLANKILQKSA
jgi:hypothetical protein